MEQEGKPPETGSPTDAPADAAPQDDARATAPPPLSADAEKDAQVEAAKARVAAAKEAAQKAAPGAPKPPVKKKEEGPKPVDASNHSLVQKLRAKVGDAVMEATEFLGQLSIRVARERIVEACRALRDDPETPFNYLSDLTCVHWPDNREAPF